LQKHFALPLKRQLVEIYMGLLTKKMKVSTILKHEIVPRSFPYINEPLALGILNANLNYLKESGWVESKVTNTSFFQGEHYPWITFPAIDFLKTLELSGLAIVEFGAGASTVYFAKRSKKVIVYEFDSSYYNVIRTPFLDFANTKIYNYDPSATKNKSRGIPPPQFEKDEQLVSCLEEDLEKFNIDADLILQTGLYNSALKNISKADLIFIDGGPRNSVLALTARFAKTSAIVVVDNSEQDYIRLGIDILSSAGFHEIPFAGIGPLNPYKWQTSFFVKNLEALSSRSKSQ
jgi:hypothetical protein